MRAITKIPEFQDFDLPDYESSHIKMEVLSSRVKQKEMSVYTDNNRDLDNNSCYTSVLIDSINLVEITNVNLSIPEKVNLKSKTTFYNYCPLNSYSFLKSNSKLFIADDNQLGIIVDTDKFISASFVFLNNQRVRFLIKNKVSYKKALLQGEIFLDDTIKNKEEYLSDLYAFFHKKNLLK